MPQTDSPTAGPADRQAVRPADHPPARSPIRRIIILRRVLGALVVLVLGLGLYLSTFVVSYDQQFRKRDRLLATDVARLYPSRVEGISYVRRLEQLRAVLQDARRRNLKVSISGSHHSQGGHTYTAGGVVLDMRGFNRILSVDPKAMLLTVESGATWDEVQRALAPQGLAVKVMQSSNIFTVGGTLSANAHGRDLDVMQVVDVVQRFHLLLADGRVIEVSRTVNPELFGLVIGGYGMYGVILDVTLRVANDELYQQQSVSMDYTEFPGRFAQVKSDPAVALMLARPSIDPDPKRFLREMVMVTWRRVGNEQTGDFQLTEEAHVWRDKLFFGLSREFDWAKSLRWNLQKRVELGAGKARLVSRNNAMRPPLAPLELLDYHSKHDTDIIQEYYVPVENFVPFMDQFRQILLDGRMNVLSSTVRYVAPSPTPVLAYAPKKPVFAIIQMSNVELSPAAQAQAELVTRRLVDAALQYGGTYYLTYQLYPTPQQLYQAYPNARRAFERKRYYDPDEIFSSHFYQKYGHAQER